MPLRRNFQARNRTFATGPLTIEPASAERAEDVTIELLGWALDVVEEHELMALEAGVALPPWLRGRDGDRRRQRLLAAVAASVQIRHDPAFFPKQFGSVSAIAARAGVDRTQLLREIGSQVQILPPIAAAGFVVDGYLGPFRAFTVYEDSGRAGRDSNAFGIHREENMAPLSRLLGVAGVGIDTVVPLTAQPLVTKTRDDPAAPGFEPERRELAREAAESGGCPVPSTAAEHLAANLDVLKGAARILRNAGAGSRACGDAGIDPREALRLAFPRWLLGPPIQLGPGASRQRPTGGRFLSPGLDADMLRAAANARLRPLFWLASGLGGPRQGADAADANALVYSRGSDLVVVGNTLVTALLEVDGGVIPDMRELSPAELELARQYAQAMALPIHKDVRYAFVPAGVLLGNTSPALPIGVVLRQSIDSTIAWATTANLRRADVRAEATAAAELHVRVRQRHEVSNCVHRYFDDHFIHGMQPNSYETRLALRTVTMLANLGIVGLNRARQVGRGPT